MRTRFFGIVLLVAGILIWFDVLLLDVDKLNDLEAMTPLYTRDLFLENASQLMLAKVGFEVLPHSSIQMIQQSNFYIPIVSSRFCRHLDRFLSAVTNFIPGNPAYDALKEICVNADSISRIEEPTDPFFHIFDEANAWRLVTGVDALVQHQGKVFTAKGSLVGSQCCFCTFVELKRACDICECLNRDCGLLSSRSCSRSCTLPTVEKLLVISTVFGSGYAHFFKESLPRLVPHLDMLRKDPTVNIHIYSSSSSTLPKFISSAFEILGLNPMRIVSGDVMASKVFIPGPTTCGFPQHQFRRLSLLRSLLLPKTSPTIKYAILIRRTVNRRLGEDTFKTIYGVLEEAIQYTDLEIKIFSDDDVEMMTCLRCQIELFSQASVIIGRHGAGLTNMMFMPAGGLVLEIGKYGGTLEYLIQAHLSGFKYYMPIAGASTDLQDMDSLRKVLVRHFSNF